MKIMFVGDISLGEYYLSFGHGPRSYSTANDLFGGVKSVFKPCDYVFGNLETPISDCGLDLKNPESVVLRGGPDSAKRLKDVGFNLLNIANNHIVQHGDAVFDETISSLKQNQIRPIGMKDEYCIIVEKDDVKVAFISASAVIDNTDPNQNKYFSLDESLVLEKIKEIKGDVNWVVVSLHWGRENSLQVTEQQVSFARKMKEAGANLIVGHHSHIFLPIDKDENFVCAWSMGNFVFDLLWDRRFKKSGIIDVDFYGDHIEANFIPVELNDFGVPFLSGEKMKINDGRFYPYNHSHFFHGMQLKKIVYFLANIFRGNTRLKIEFIKIKIIKVFRKKYIGGDL